ncbi:1389_t:CDS:1 [Funneliformis geosporum]|uniref:7940_t:CDS:1 n=1 Tax=Funneliformis geosporum TaxID=1117311 RepID=A0A9W4SQ31_9GLOM|nr:7940_t:CDS:1 [Funneliformis geosporum]CAI2185090.1 1389_t:CDS:1 [Funneliformis geosporum]
MSLSHNKFNIQHLPYEVLQQIFILSSNPNFAFVSRLFHNIATSQTSVKTQWLLHKFNYDCTKALYRGLKWRFFNKTILNQLDSIYYQSKLKKGENSSDEVIQVIPCKDRAIPQWFFSIPDPKGTYYEMVKILLERGASPNESDGYPIIKSAQLGRLKMAKLLLSFNANPGIKDNMALKVTAKDANIEMVNLLIKRGAKPDSDTLRIAVERKHWHMAELLVSHGAPATPEVVAAFEKNK